MALGDKVFGLQYSTQEINTWAISLEEGNEGQILFSETWDAPAAWEEGQLEIEFNAISLEDGVAVIWTKDTLEYYAFSTDTGEYLWGPAEPEFYVNYYGWTEFGERPPFIYDGKLYSSGAGGYIYCYDLTDGSVLWTYQADDPYQEYLFANNWWQFFLFVADGKLYSAHLEHSAIEPMPRGAPFLCLDATTGELLWRADGLFRSSRWGGRGIIGDSIMVGMDTYDNQLYAVGKGPSDITVEAPLTASAWGQKIVLRGTVVDTSPGTQTDEMKLRFPKGVPAVSDGDMSAWMRHVYKQFSCPMVSGVPVKLEVVVDPNGNWYDIGTAYTDATGFYSIEWEPPVPGHYLILASFAGSKAYYPSYVETSIIVDEGLTPGSFMEPEFPMSTGSEQQAVVPLISTDSILIVAVTIWSIIGVAAYWLLKRK
jgi:hypothetical protein